MLPKSHKRRFSDPWIKRTPLKPRSKKRIAKDRLLGKVKRQLWARCNGHCEVPWCSRQANDAHHVRKRSQGGMDTLNNLVALCRSHHDQTDLPDGLHIGSYQGGDIYGFVFRLGDGQQIIGPFTLEA